MAAHARTSRRKKPRRKPAPPSPVFCVQRRAGVDLISPSPLGLLPPAVLSSLSVPQPTFQYDPVRHQLVKQTGQQLVVEHHPAAHQWRHGVELWAALPQSDFIELPTGKLAEVTAALQQIGAKVERAQADADPAGVDPPQQETPTRGRFLVKVPRPADRMEYLTKLCRGMPGQRIAIVVGTRSQSETVRQRLQANLCEPVGMTQGLEWPSGPRIAICTFQALNVLATSRPIMILVPYAEELAGTYARRVLQKCDWPVIGTYCDLSGASDGQMAWLGSLFQGQLIDTTTAAHGTPQIWVQRVRVSCGIAELPMTKKKMMQWVDNQRLFFWKNSEYNNQMARLARLLARRNRQQLQRSGIMAPPNSTGRVCVLVENTEHALALHTHLPQASVRHCSVRHAALPAGPADIEIMTLAAARKHKLNTDVIIVASGGEGLPELLNLDRIRRPCGRSQWVYEPVPDNPQLEAASSRRIKSYTAAGWRRVSKVRTKKKMRT